MTYPKRLIEVDLPIRRISEHARREKSIRHGHISTLHIWWARRPLAACRAVLCASLWPDPVDPLCPQAFRDAAAEAVNGFSKAIRESETVQKIMGTFSGSFLALEKERLDAKDPKHWNTLRYLLFDFIAQFAAWEASTEPHFLETARKLTQDAHEALGGAPGTRPLVVDPFAGGGSIPLEALRIGADAFASDLNPVAVLLNKVVLEYIPKYGQRLADEVRKWGQWIKEQAEKELAEFYPKDPDGATPIAYLWARTITCEGPGCGVELPLMRSLWLAKKSNRSVALRLITTKKEKRPSQILFAIVERHGQEWILIESPSISTLPLAAEYDPDQGTVKRGSATCPVCGYTTPPDRVRYQLSTKCGGSKDARMTVVVRDHPHKGTMYNLPTAADTESDRLASEKLRSLQKDIRLSGHEFSPQEKTPTNESHRSVGSLWIYGMHKWEDVYTNRQLLVLGTLCRIIQKAGREGMSPVAHCLFALCVGKTADYLSTLCLWRTARSCVAHTFGRQALPIVWDFGEMNPFAGSAGDWLETVRYLDQLVSAVLASVPGKYTSSSELADATAHPLPDDSADSLVTDPPYYDSVVYAELSDYL